MIGCNQLCNILLTNLIQYYLEGGDVAMKIQWKLGIKTKTIGIWPANNEFVWMEIDKDQKGGITGIADTTHLIWHLGHGRCHFEQHQNSARRWSPFSL